MQKSIEGLTLTEASDGCSSLHVVLGFIVPFFMSFSMLFRTPILGRCTNAPRFLHFCIKVLKILVLNRYQVNTGPTTKPIPTLVTCQGSRPYKWGDQWVMTYEMNHY